MTQQDYKPSDIMRWFDSAHIQSPTIKAWMKALGNIAEAIDRHLAPGAEKATALRKLLEAKDATTRAVISTAEGAAITVGDPIAPTLRSACLSLGAHLLDALEGKSMSHSRWTLSYDGNREIRCAMPIADRLVKARQGDQPVTRLHDWHLEVRVALSSIKRVHSVNCLIIRTSADPGMTEGLAVMRDEGILTASEESKQPLHSEMATAIAINLVTSLNEAAWKARACPPAGQTFDSEAMEVARLIVANMQAPASP